MENKEIWRNIEGYEGLYQVSSEGRVKSLDRYVNNNGGLEYREGKMLKGCKDRGGYLRVDLYKDGKQKHFPIHRLVAQAFLPNPNNLPEVNHKDEDKTNNKVENIEYCDSRYNTNFGTRNERIGEKHKIRILQFTLNGKLVRKWDSITEAEQELGFHHSSICMCCKGKRKSTGGFIWGYEKDYEKIPFNTFVLELYRKRVA